MQGSTLVWDTIVGDESCEDYGFVYGISKISGNF